MNLRHGQKLICRAKKHHWSKIIESGDDFKDNQLPSYQDEVYVDNPSALIFHGKNYITLIGYRRIFDETAFMLPILRKKMELSNSSPNTQIKQ